MPNRQSDGQKAGWASTWIGLASACAETGLVEMRGDAILAWIIKNGADEISAASSYSLFCLGVLLQSDRSLARRHLVLSIDLSGGAGAGSDGSNERPVW